MTALQHYWKTFRHVAVTEREKGAYFERLVKTYLLNEHYYRDLYAGRVVHGPKGEAVQLFSRNRP
jgi:hypothetical protein